MWVKWTHVIIANKSPSVFFCFIFRGKMALGVSLWKSLGNAALSQWVAGRLWKYIPSLPVKFSISNAPKSHYFPFLSSPWTVQFPHRTPRSTHPMTLEHLALGGQRDVHVLLLLQQIRKRSLHVGMVAIPSQTHLLLDGRGRLRGRRRLLLLRRQQRRRRPRDLQLRRGQRLALQQGRLARSLQLRTGLQRGQPLLQRHGICGETGVFNVGTVSTGLTENVLDEFAPLLLRLHAVVQGGVVDLVEVGGGAEPPAADHVAGGAPEDALVELDALPFRKLDQAQLRHSGRSKIHWPPWWVWWREVGATRKSILSAPSARCRLEVGQISGTVTRVEQ